MTNKTHPPGQTANPGPSGGDAPYLFHFVLLDGFSNLSLNSALETLQNANLVAGKTLYAWQLVGQTRDAVTSSIGRSVEVDCEMKQVAGASDIVIVSGDHSFDLDIRSLKVWLGRVARRDVRVSGLGTGAIVMARAGLLNDCDVSIHPWYRVGLVELMPEITLGNRTHNSDGLRCSSSGGVSGIDLFLDFIERRHGAGLADNVAESMCYTSIRRVQKSIDTTVPNSQSVLHPVVSEAISFMEKNLEEPVSPSVLAAEAGISTRQLERLFVRYLGTPPKRLYMRLRLRAAYRLLVQSRLSVTDVALTTGFNSQSHFSRCFNTEFGVTPHKLRGAQR